MEGSSGGRPLGAGRRSAAAPALICAGPCAGAQRAMSCSGCIHNHAAWWCGHSRGHKAPAALAPPGADARARACKRAPLPRAQRVERRSCRRALERSAMLRGRRRRHSRRRPTRRSSAGLQGGVVRAYKAEWCRPTRRSGAGLQGGVARAYKAECCGPTRRSGAGLQGGVAREKAARGGARRLHRRDGCTKHMGRSAAQGADGSVRGMCDRVLRELQRVRSVCRTWPVSSWPLEGLRV
jgi:hypothetical protein